MSEQLFEPGNPVRDKISLRLGNAGSGSSLGPILSGLGGKMILQLDHSEETLVSWDILWGPTAAPLVTDIYPGAPSGFSFASDGYYEYEFTFGVNTGTSDGGIKNIVEWRTRPGTAEAGEPDTIHRKFFYVKTMMGFADLYINNQIANNFTTPGLAEIPLVHMGHPTGLSDPFTDSFGSAVSLAFDILPTYGDEFFAIHEYSGNRWANIRKNWGGVATAEVFIADRPDEPVTSLDVIISERPVQTVTSVNWVPFVPVAPDENDALGVYRGIVRLRAKEGSVTRVDLPFRLELEAFDA